METNEKVNNETLYPELPHQSRQTSSLYIADTKGSHVFNHQITQILQQKEENTGINNTKISAGQLLN